MICLVLFLNVLYRLRVNNLLEFSSFDFQVTGFLSHHPTINVDSIILRLHVLAVYLVEIVGTS